MTAPRLPRRPLRAAAITTALALLSIVPATSASAYPVQPGPVTTGVPTGTALTPSGSLWVKKDGTVLDGLDINGCVVIDAKDVTIRNTRIRCAKPIGGVMAVQVTDRGDRLLVEDTEIDGLGRVEVGVGWSKYTLRRVNIHGVADGARFGHRVLIEDSWIHGLSRIRSLHSDAVQTTSASDTVIRNNVLDSVSADGKDLNNAAIMLGSETGTRKVVNVLIEGNVLAGGNFTVNVRADINASNVVVRGNTFVPGSRYGQFLAPSRVPLGPGNALQGGAAIFTRTAK